MYYAACTILHDAHLQLLHHCHQLHPSAHHFPPLLTTHTTLSLIHLMMNIPMTPRSPHHPHHFHVYHKVSDNRTCLSQSTACYSHECSMCDVCMWVVGCKTCRGCFTLDSLQGIVCLVCNDILQQKVIYTHTHRNTGTEWRRLLCLTQMMT